MIEIPIPGKAVFVLTHWGRVTHMCVSNLTTIGSVNGLSPGRRQAITWTNAGILLIGPLGPNFSEILIETSTFSFKKMRLKVSSAKWRPFFLGLNLLRRGLAVICVGNDIQPAYRWYKAVISFLIQTTPQNERCYFNLWRWDTTAAHLRS